MSNTFTLQLANYLPKSKYVNCCHKYNIYQSCVFFEILFTLLNYF